MRNDVRNEICNAGLKLWQELPAEEKAKVRAIITSLTAPTQGGSEE